jgi:two-component system sensor histidine kinase HydH
VEPTVREQSVPRLSLRNKLLLFAVATVVLPGVLLGSLATRNASTALEAQVGRSLAREASQTADHLSAVLEAERQTLEAFAHQDLMRDVRVDDVDKRVSMALSALRSQRELAPHYRVRDPAGDVVAASDAEAMRDGHAAGDSRAGSDEPQQLVMASRIADPDDPQRSLGTLLAIYDWAALAGVARAVEHDLVAQGLAASVLVTNAAGVPYGRELPRESVLARGAREAERPALVAPDWVVQASTGLIVGRAPLVGPGAAARVLVIVGREVALAPVASLQRRMALTLGVALAVALALAALASRRVVRPLTELTEAIRKLARRESAAPLSVRVRSDDELGALAGAFNRMAADLERTQHDLVEAEKFAFVGELAAGVAHEIRTSLGVLGSSAQLLDRSLPADANAEVRELAQMVREEVGRLGGVVDDLLTLKSERPLRLEAGALSPLLARAAEFAARAARAKRVRIALAAAPAVEPLVLREPELIHQVAVNLLVNAVQALREGGTIEVVLLAPREGFAGFEVRDDGPGIPAEFRERVFQPFVTGRSGGVGLGLTFVKRVVHEHRGRVAIASEPGRGTRVRVELPLAGTQP